MSADQITQEIRTPGQILMESTIHGSEWHRQTGATRAKWERHASEVCGTISHELRKARADVQRLRDELARRSDAGRVEVPELVYSHEEAQLVRAVGGDPEWDAAVFGAGYNLARSRSRLSPSPQPATRADLESLIHAVAMAAYDEGVEAGIAWDPDADPTKKGVTPLAPEEGLRHSRAHFAEHGAGSPIAPFSIALQALRDALQPSPQPSADVVVVPRPLSDAPTDRPILAFWQGGIGTISDVVHYFEDEGRFVCWCEMLEHEDKGGELDLVPRDAQWIELPDALRSSTNHDSKETP